VSLDERLADLTPAQRELLRARLKTIRPTRQTPIPARGEPNRARLSLDQERIWLIHQFGVSGPMYNVFLAHRLSGDLDVDALRYAVNAVVQRHEALRTTFELAGARPVQVIHAAMQVPVAVEDLRALPEGRREAELEQRARSEVRRPIDIANGPLMRVVLFRTGDAEHVMVLTVDHLVWDRQSAGIFQADLSEFYRARRDRREPNLPDLPIQYADYAEWQPGWIDGEVRTRQLPYWRDALAGAPASLELPPDHPRPPAQTFNGARYTFRLSRRLTDAIRDLARAERVTDYVALLAVWNLLLHRYTGETDIVVGTTSSTRSRPETEHVIGYFLTMLPLRTHVTGAMTFRDLLRATQMTMVGAMDHNDIPFGLLLDELDIPRDPARNPLYQNSFLFVNFREDPLALHGVTVTPAVFDNRTAKDECMVCVFDDPAECGGFFGLIEYNTDLYDETTIDRMWRHFELLLECATSDPPSPVGDYPVAGPGSFPQARALKPDACVEDLVLRQVAQAPGRVAVTDGTEELTYAELADRATRLAGFLRERGAGPEAVVGVCLDHGIDLPVAIFGVLLSGAAYLPLDPRHPGQRIGAIAADAGVCLVLARGKLSALLADAGLATADVDGDQVFAGPPASARPPADAAPEAEAVGARLAYVIYTSGSTGRPKGVGVEHRSLVNYLEWARKRYPGAAGAALLHSSLAYDMAVTSLFVPLVSGGTVAVAPPGALGTDGRGLGHAGNGEEGSLAATLLKVTPSHLAMLNALPASRANGTSEADVADVADLVVGGEALSIEQMAAWRQRHPGSTVVNEYGPTEATVGCIAYSLQPGSALPAGIHGVPIGQPIDNAEAYILDERLQPTPVGVTGELYVAGGVLARGYLGRPDLTAERFTACPFGEPGRRMYRTGDLVRRRPDGDLEYLGRADRQVKLRGHRIEPAEIEACLAGHPDVAQTVVVVREDRPGDKRLVAYIRARKSNADPEALRAHAAALPEHMIPSAVVLVERFPLTPNGKLDSDALPTPIPEHRSSEVRPPRDVLELEVTRIWEEVLGVRPIGLHDRFFDLGGHSMLALALVTETERRLGRRLPVESLFRGATVEFFAALLRDATIGEENTGHARLVELRPGTGRPVYFPHLAGGEIACYGPLTGLLDLADRPLYAIAGPALGGDGQLPYASFGQQATAYADLIRARQPDGPYDIVGWSYGGIVGYSVAAALESDGAGIRLVLLGTGPQRHSVTDPLPDRAEVVYTLALNLLSGSPDGLLPVARLRQMTADEHAEYLLALGRAADILPPSAGSDHMRARLDTWVANLSLYLRYDLPPLASGFTLVRGAEEDAASFAGWIRPGRPDPSVHTVDGDHFTMMAFPRIVGLASTISHALGDGPSPAPARTGSDQ
jgi:amino acid adenylation domain-containing protein